MLHVSIMRVGQYPHIQEDVMRTLGLAMVAVVLMYAVATSAEAWPTVVCGAGPNLAQTDPAIAPTGVGGAFVVFSGTLLGTQLPSSYGKYLMPSGEGFPASACGDTIFGTTGLTGHGSVQPRVIADGQGGFIVAAQETRNGSSQDIYAQRTGQFGGRIWGDLGVPVCTASDDQRFAATTYGAIASDGQGGCYITWEDDRNLATTGIDVYVQHLTSSGTVSSGWPVDGFQLSNRPGSQCHSSLKRDGSTCQAAA